MRTDTGSVRKNTHGEGVAEGAEWPVTMTTEPFDHRPPGGDHYVGMVGVRIMAVTPFQSGRAFASHMPDVWVTGNGREIDVDGVGTVPVSTFLSWLDGLRETIAEVSR